MPAYFHNSASIYQSKKFKRQHIHANFGVMRFMLSRIWAFIRRKHTQLPSSGFQKIVNSKTGHCHIPTVPLVDQEMYNNLCIYRVFCVWDLFRSQNFR